MSKVISRYLVVGILLLGSVCWWQRQRMTRIGEERDRYRQNSEALLSDVRRIQVDSATMAVDVKSLRLTVDEYKRLRAEDAEKIRQMGVKLKNLQAAARHEISVDAPVDAPVRDTVVVRDSSAVALQRVDMHTPYIQLTGMIENKRLTGRIRIPVTLHQVVWIEYKRKWIFWKKAKAIHQTISSDNPYVEIKYSEFIQIQK